MAKKKIKYAVVYNYNRTKKLNKAGEAAIYVRAYLKGNSKFINTGIYIKPNQWNGGGIGLIKNHPNSAYLNEAIRDQVSQLEIFEYQCYREGRSITLDQLLEYESRNESVPFVDFCFEQLELSKNRIVNSSYTDQRQTINKFKEFKSNISITGLSFKVIKEFDNYLFSLGLGTNTVGKHHKNLKKFINLAMNLDYLDVNNDPYKKFKVNREPSHRIFLTEEELLSIEKLEFSTGSDHLIMIRDFFLFMCWTGLRYTDASKLTAHNFSESEQGIILQFKSTKTRKPHTLKLRKLFGGKPDTLISSYLTKFDSFYYDDPENPRQIFFGLTNQHVNRELKTLVADLKIRLEVKTKISCHVARHSFGTILAGKIKTAILQKLMQHSNIRETMRYVHLNQEFIDKELDKVNW